MNPLLDPLDLAHTQIQDYNPEWKALFEFEAAELRDALGDAVTSIEHIGSTAIPGLASKPIIDIAITVPSWKQAESLLVPLAQLGYPSEIAHIDETNVGERWLLRKNSPNPVHLSIAYGDRECFLERQILFRDYLRNHDADRDAYATLKRELITKDPTGKDSYIGNKTDFVMRVLKKAGFQNPWFDLSKY